MIVNKQEKKKKPPKYTGFLIITGIVFTAIVARLIYVQVINMKTIKKKQIQPQLSLYQKQHLEE